MAVLIAERFAARTILTGEFMRRLLLAAAAVTTAAALAAAPAGAQLVMYDVVTSDIAGLDGGVPPRSVQIEPDAANPRSAIDTITLRRRNGNICSATVAGGDVRTTNTRESATRGRCGPNGANDYITADFAPAAGQLREDWRYVYGLTVCMEDGRVRGMGVATTLLDPATGEQERPQFDGEPTHGASYHQGDCSGTSQPLYQDFVYCPARSIAVGLDLYHDGRGAGGAPHQITGVALRCRVVRPQ